MKKEVKKLVGPLALWSGLWLLVSAFLEVAQKGYVVHHINTRWVILLFGISSVAWLVSKDH